MRVPIFTLNTYNVGTKVTGYTVCSTMTPTFLILPTGCDWLFADTLYCSCQTAKLTMVGTVTEINVLCPDLHQIAMGSSSCSVIFAQSCWQTIKQTNRRGQKTTYP